MFTAIFNLDHMSDYRNSWNNERWKSYNKYFSIIIVSHAETSFKMELTICQK